MMYSTRIGAGLPLFAAGTERCGAIHASELGRDLIPVVPLREGARAPAELGSPFGAGHQRVEMPGDLLDLERRYDAGTGGVDVRMDVDRRADDHGKSARHRLQDRVA